MFKLTSSSVLSVLKSPDKTRAASLVNVLKDIPGKVCLNGVDNNDAIVNVRISICKKY